MLNVASLLAAFASLAVAVFGVEAAPMNKCVAKGAVTYQQGPCPSTEPRREPTLEELNSAEKKRRATKSLDASAAPGQITSAPTPAATATTIFSCDGRTYCSQMRSCEEAKYFLANCRGVKMDGDRNGIPCEQQWCSR